MSTRENDVNVHFTVRVPRGVAFAPRTVNGDVAAEGLEGDVSVRTVNGSVEVSTTGHADAQTVNGSIRASAAAGGLERRRRVQDGQRQHHGDPAFLHLRRRARGDGQRLSIGTDFALTVSGRLSRRHLSGTIGGGGRSLEMETVNGSIHLRKSS